MKNKLLLSAFILNKIKQNIPNAITCGNLLCGCLAITQVFLDDLVWAAYLVGIAAVLDFMDGFFARLLHVSSPIGKDLDSLADMVTFGVVPGMIMFKLAETTIEQGGYAYESEYIAFLIPIFSAIRLAKFNHDTRQSESFIGLPTPANAILISSIPLILTQTGNEQSFIFLRNPYTLALISCVLSYLLIAELPLFSLKFKSFSWKENEIRFMFLLLSLLLLITLHFVGIPLIIVLYIVMSVINNLLNKKDSR